MPVTPGVSTRRDFLWGGCGLGAAIEALEGTTGRPVIWATSQYLSFAVVPSIVDIDVTVAVEGNAISQARAVAHVGDREILTVNAALGQRDIDVEGTWAEMPEVPKPDECPERLNTDDNTMMSRLEFRLANARNREDIHGHPAAGGRSTMWARMPDIAEISASALAILGDYVPFGIGQALGRRAGGNSLDNTLRMFRADPTEWVLLDIQVHAVANGFGHGLVQLWSETGTLLATASQSTIVRFHDAEDEARS